MTSCKILQIGHKQIKGIPKTGGRIPYAMGQVQPAETGLDRAGPQAILGFIDRMIDPGVDDGLLFHDGMGDGVGKTETQRRRRCPH